MKGCNTRNRKKLSEIKEKNSEVVNSGNLQKNMNMTIRQAGQLLREFQEEEKET